MEQEFRYIYEVYKTGSFTKAADALYLTQPALSTAVRKIEQRIGMSLFDRSRHPLQLTEAGRIFIRTIEKIRMEEESLDLALSDIRDLESGTLTIGGSHYVNVSILPRILKDFSDRYPGIEIRLVEESAAELAKLLANREIDLTFSCDEHFIASFDHHTAFKDTVILAVSADNPVTGELAECCLTWEDIAGKRHLEEMCPCAGLARFASLPFIILTPGNNLHDRAVQLFEEAGITPKIRLRLSQLATSMSFAAADYGAAFVSDRMVRPHDNSLRYFKINSGITKRRFCALLPDRDYTPAAVRAFLRFFREAAGEKEM